jgi:hypothetical protein
MLTYEFLARAHQQHAASWPEQPFCVPPTAEIQGHLNHGNHFSILVFDEQDKSYHVWSVAINGGQKRRPGIILGRARNPE